MIHREFFRFALVGTLGFAIDGGLVQALVSMAQADPYLARVASFLAAVTTTWMLHRRYTFPASAGRRAGSQWSLYMMTSIIGALVNVGVYTGCLLTWQFFRIYPILAVAMGTLPALAINFTASRQIVFRGPPKDARTKRATPP